jgi:hypothetical protein
MGDSRALVQAGSEQQKDGWADAQSTGSQAGLLARRGGQAMVRSAGDWRAAGAVRAVDSQVSSAGTLEQAPARECLLLISLLPATGWAAARAGQLTPARSFSGRARWRRRALHAGRSLTRPRWARWARWRAALHPRRTTPDRRPAIAQFCAHNQSSHQNSRPLGPVER